MPWPVIVQLVAPYGVELIEYVLSLFAKEKSGQTITPEEWHGLAKLHASKTAAQDLADSILRAQLPKTP